MKLTTDDILQLAATKSDKYFDLVWYARSAPADSEYWDKVPASIKRGALNSQARVEEMFPDETDKLSCANCGDWEHGFNSGMLAGLRYVMSAIEDGPEHAEEEFPELDS